MIDQKLKIFYIFVGLLLVVASFLKTTGAATQGIQTGKTEFVAGVTLAFIEFSLGTWLVFHDHRGKTTGLLVFCLFFGFGVYQLTLVQAGKSDCGCFGNFHFPPIFVALFDFAIATIAFRGIQKINSTDIESENHSASIWRTIAIIGCVSIWTIYSCDIVQAMNVPISITSIRSLTENTAPIVKPLVKIDEELVGQEIDFSAIVEDGLENIDLSAIRNVMFVRDGCEKCDQAKSKLLSSTGTISEHTLIVRLSPKRSVDPPTSTGFREVHARDDIAWVVSTPLYVEITSSKVTKISDCQFFSQGE